MNTPALVLILICSIQIVFKNKATLTPLLLPIFLISTGPAIQTPIAPINTPKIIAIIAIFKLITKGSTKLKINKIDLLVITFLTWQLTSSIISPKPDFPPSFILHATSNFVLPYLASRLILSESNNPLETLKQAIHPILVITALGMLLEHALNHNIFSIFGGVPEIPGQRNDQIRAQGPFGHAILAGTFGAISACLYLKDLKKRNANCIIGLSSSTLIVLSSASSGPIASLAIVTFIYFGKELLLKIRHPKTTFIIVYLGLSIMLSSPAYYIVARIDLTGSSTGWHRARLIETSIEHLNEWWLTGTGYTRHWMESGVGFSSNHVDVTNYFLLFGIWGGIPAILIFISIYYTSIKHLLKDKKTPSTRNWTIITYLSALIITSLTISFYDQTSLLTWIPFAVTSTLIQQEEHSVRT